MRSLRILATGSRSWTDRAAIRTRLRWVAEVYGVPYNMVTVVHGDADGADRIAAEEAESLGMRVEAHPVPKQAWKISRRAGYDRNSHMVNLGADICLAFLGRCVKPRCDPRPHASHGASHCADLAERSGIVTERLVLVDV